MMVRALVVWFILLVLASANGALREGVIIPAAGDVAGRAVSTILLSAIILLLSWLTIGWMAPRSAGEAWAIGALWVALTLAFEFLAGRYLFGKPWPDLFEDYNLAAGRIWILALITTAVAPWLMARWRGLAS